MTFRRFDPNTPLVMSGVIRLADMYASKPSESTSSTLSPQTGRQPWRNGTSSKPRYRPSRTNLQQPISARKRQGARTTNPSTSTSPSPPLSSRSRRSSGAARSSARRTTTSCRYRPATPGTARGGRPPLSRCWRGGGSSTPTRCCGT